MKYELRKLTKKDIKQLKEEEKKQNSKKQEKKSIKDLFKIVD
nr:hypothetical protein [Mycoplasma mycoides]